MNWLILLKLQCYIEMHEVFAEVELNEEIVTVKDLYERMTNLN